MTTKKTRITNMALAIATTAAIVVLNGGLFVNLQRAQATQPFTTFDEVEATHMSFINEVCKNATSNKGTP
jgi:hypothetical protein